MENSNEATIIFDSRPENEGLARVTAAAFCTQLNPTLEEVADLKTAVSEAVTNCIIHGYKGEIHKIRMKCRLKENTIYLDIEDDGVGIPDIAKAMEPLYTTRADQDRSGMGFTFMEAFMDGERNLCAYEQKNRKMIRRTHGPYSCSHRACSPGG